MRAEHEFVFIKKKTFHTRIGAKSSNNCNCYSFPCPVTLWPKIKSMTEHKGITTIPISVLHNID